jgi:ADP-heptose:LPS heptosyltransferase
MSELRGRLLFVPVSGPRGMGEYARALALASAAVQRWPRLEVHFALSAAAPYAAETPFDKTLLPSSPTFHTKEVTALIGRLRPDLVVFDNAGRTAQLRAAAANGARVVFVSSRKRQRRKAFRLSWMRAIDEHWIAYPSFIAGELAFLERAKLAWMKRPTLRFLDTVLPLADAPLATELLQQFSLRSGEYVLVVPGGGTGHPGVEDAPTVIARAAHEIASAGHPTLIVGVAPQQQSAELRVAPRMPMAMLGELIRNAKLVVSNGGDTLLQVIACAKPCVAVPIAGDQAHRIAKCERRGLATSARLDSSDLARATLALLANDARRSRIAVRAANGGITNGLGVALSAVEKLLKGSTLPPAG